MKGNKTSFNNLPPWKALAIQVRGGRSGGHRFTVDEAKVAGRKGGLASAARRAAKKQERTV